MSYTDNGKNNSSEGSTSSITLDIKFEDISDQVPIGSGSFGKVFRADYLGTDVAVKEFFQKVPDMPGYDFHKYFERELNLLREARHPNIVQFMGTCLHDSRIYMLTEYVPGGNLKDWISDHSDEESSDDIRKQFVSYRLRTSFAIDIARALAYLHARGIIHRDLKLENLLLTENYRIKVCDFGFSRVVAKNDAERRKLSFCGTDGYMAPEIILCMDNYDTSVDIFSYGVLVLCLVVLRSPANDGRPEDPPFARLMPGFGLSSEAIEAGFPSNWPMREKLMKMVISCVDDEPKKRNSLKDVLQILKETETKLVQQIREEEEKTGVSKVNSALNVGLYTSLAKEDGKRAIQELGTITGDSHSDLIGSPRASIDVGSLRQLSVGNLPSPLHQSSSNNNLSASSMPEITSNSPSTIGRVKHEIPHRFSLVFSPISLTSLKCNACSRTINGFMHRHLVCDDCGILCHKKCGKLMPPNCGLKLNQATYVITHRTESRKSLSRLAALATFAPPLPPIPSEIEQPKPIKN